MLENTTYYLLSALAALIVLSIHELSHGYVAYKLGDPTAKLMGRLTLNPLKHIDPVGAIMMVIFHIGWAKPVPINAANFKNPKRDFAISALAGPLSNMILAFFASFLYLLLFALVKDVSFTSRFFFSLVENALLFIYLLHMISIGLGVFNLLPIPPLDGSRILYAILPTKAYFAVMKYEKQIYYGVLAWLLLGDMLARGLLSLPFAKGSVIFEAIAEILSLTGILSSVNGFISDLMMNFWQLIPFLKF